MRYTCVTAAVLWLTTMTSAWAQSSDTLVVDLRGVTSWALSAQPLLRIGVTDGPVPETFMRITDVREMKNGVIAVADQLAYEVRFFDPNGIHLASRGRRGRGPGEFESLGQLLDCAPSADQILARDGATGRYISYSPEGAPVVTSAIVEDLKRAPMMTLCGSRGLLVVTSWPEFIAPTPGVYRPPMQVLVVDLRGTVRARIGRFPGQERERLATSDRPREFGKSLIVTANQRHIYVATNDAPEVYVYTYAGAMPHVLRLNLPVRRVTAAIKSALRDEALKTVYNRSRRPQMERYYDDMVYPKTLPYFRDALTDVWGRLWLEEYPEPGSTLARWFVFDVTHQLVARIGIPRSLKLHQIGPDWVLGVTQDESGVQRIEKVRYGIPRR